MIATKTINPGDWFTWYYGHFHEIFKRACNDAASSSDDEEDDDSEAVSADLDENDSEDEVNMAVKLSAQLAEDHRLALELQQSLDHADDDDKFAAKSGFDSKQKGKRDAVVDSSSESESQAGKKCKRKMNLDALPMGNSSKPLNDGTDAPKLVVNSGFHSKRKGKRDAFVVGSSESEAETGKESKRNMDLDAPPRRKVQKRKAVAVAGSEPEVGERAQCEGKEVDTLTGVTKSKALNIDDVCYLTSLSSDGSVRFQKCVVKSRTSDILTGLFTHYDISFGNPATRCFIGAVKAHKDLVAHSKWKKERLQANLIAREAAQEAVRQASRQKYLSGALKYVPCSSPGNSPVHLNGGGEDQSPVNSPVHVAGGEGNQSPGNSPVHLNGGGEDQSPVNSPVHVPGGGGDNDGDFYDEGTYGMANASDGEVVDDNVSDEGNTTMNESGLEALELQRAALVIDLSTISAEDIWKMFQNKTIKGGILARTLFIAGKLVDTKICEPWIGDKKLATKKLEVVDQRNLFISWASTTRVIDWIRLEIFKIVLSKPHTYKSFSVTHLNGPKAVALVDGKDVLEATQASDSTMARIAHLACSPDSRVVLNMIFGTKMREACGDAPDLTPAALWQDLATVYVNNPNWDIRQINVLQLQQMTNVNGTICSSSLIDVSQVQLIGVTAECVRLVFTEIKQMFSQLANAVGSPTGCNSSGEELYSKVWSNYIKGKLLYFRRPVTAMYVFKLWHECHLMDTLPKYCIKELHPNALVRLGVRNQSETSKFTLPMTPRPGSSGLSQGFASPPTPSTDTTNSLDTVASYLSYKMKQEMKHEDEIRAARAAEASSIAPKLPQVKS